MSFKSKPGDSPLPQLSCSAIKWEHFRVIDPSWEESTGQWWIPLTKNPVTRSFNVFFDVRLNPRLNKQWSCRRYKTPWWSCDVTVICVVIFTLLVQSFNSHPEVFFNLVRYYFADMLHASDHLRYLPNARCHVFTNLFRYEVFALEFVSFTWCLQFDVYACKIMHLYSLIKVPDSE